MAELLHRLGVFAARRPWTVIVSWLLILGIAAGGFAVGFKGLVTTLDIPNTASGDVVEELEEKLPEMAGASGTIVFHSENGEALTEEQRTQITQLGESATSLPHVDAVIDPFEAADGLADQRQQIEDGRTQIAQGRAEAADGQQQLDDARMQLDAAYAELDAGREQIEAAPLPEDMKQAQLDALAGTQAEIDAGYAELDEQQAKIEEGLATIEEEEAKLERGAELLSFAENIRVVSDDGATALMNILFTEARLDLPQESKDAIMEHFLSASIDGVSISVSNEIAQGIPEVFGVGEVIGLLVAAITLIVVLGSLLAAAFPLITALVGVGIAAMATLAFSGVVEIASITPILGVMLGLAVGIDYALFVLYRHRKQLLRGFQVEQSIGLANGTAGNAVVFAGATVVVALLALNITGVPFLGLMGTVGAVSVAIAVLIAISVTPALLGLAGTKILSKRARARAANSATRPDETVQSDVRPMSTFRAVATVIGTVVALLAIAAPALSMRLGLPDGGAEAVDSTGYEAYTVTADAFGDGVTGPLLVTAHLTGGLGDDGVQEEQLEIARDLASRTDIVGVAPVGISDDHTLAVFQVVPAEGPNSISTDELVRELRTAIPPGLDTEYGVAGQAAGNIDISEGLADALPSYLAIVVGLSFLIMVMVFRSILVPLIATGGFVLSLFATYGAVTAVFQWGWLSELLGVHDPGPILSFLPVILIGILFGLAMDYQLFLTSGMREAYMHGAPARLAVAQGFRAGRTVVTAAAIIMISVFGGFIASDSVMIKSMGFGLALGILFDAFIVRMLLVPAIMHLIGRGAWWLPKWLDRIIPNVDVEGTSLERRHPVPH